MLGVWISIAVGLLSGLLGVVAAVKGALEIGVLLAVATSIAFSAATWYYGKNEGWVKTQKRLRSGLTFLVLGLTLPPVTYYALQPPYPIAVSPARVELTALSDLPNKLRGCFNITVYNRSDAPQYDVWVRLVVSSRILRTETLDLDFPTMEEKERSLSVKAMLDMAVGTMCLGGMDQYKFPAFLCVIDKLDPKEMFTIKFTSRYSIDTSSPERVGHLSAFVLKVSDHPSQHYDNSKDQKVTSAVIHSTPVPFSPTSMIHFCPNISEAYKLPTNATCTPNSKHNLKNE